MRRLVVSFALIASILLTTVVNISNVFANYTLTELRQLAREAAGFYGVDARLIFAIIQQESGWKPEVVSHAGAIGVMQIMPGTGKSACGLTRKQLYNAEKNINCGVKYFSQQLKKFGNVRLALCAYNAGPGKAQKGLARCNRISETRDYIKKIMRIWGSGKESHEIPDDFVDVYSAKTIADHHFIYGNYQDYSQWWKLVCEAVDDVYYKKNGRREPAITQSQQRLWRRILSTTVDDIYADIIRFGQQRKWSRNRLKSKITNACPKDELPPIKSNEFIINESAIDLADKWFKQGNYQSGNDWWRLLCKAIDEVYYQRTGNRRAIIEKHKNIWHKIFNATVDEFHRKEVRKGNHYWSKRRIKRKILGSCHQ